MFRDPLNAAARRGVGLSCAAGAAWGLERLEGRVLLTVTYEPVALRDLVDLDGLVETVPAPDSALMGFGARTVGLGDVDGDEAHDFAVAAPGVRGSGLADPWVSPEGGGRVFVYSGRTRSVLRTLGDGAAGFGAVLVNLGDVTGDGVADLGVGSPMSSARAGRLWVYSGADGGVVWAIDGAAGDDLGWSAANVGDVTGDGVPDVIVGAPGAGGVGGMEGAGRAYVLSGADGSEFHRFEGETAGERFGFAVAGGLDAAIANGPADGVPEYLVGAPGYDGVGADSGRASLIDGATGTVRLTMDGAQTGGQMGHAVLMDPVGGPWPRLIVGEPGHNGVAGPGSGVVWIFPFYGTLLGTIPGQRSGAEAGARFGTDVFAMGGGYGIGVTAPGGASAARLWLIAADAFVSATPTAFGGASGASWAAAADLDGDGTAEAIAGFASEGEGGEARVVPRVFGGGPLWSWTATASRNGRWIVYRTFVPEPVTRQFLEVLLRDGETVLVNRLPGIRPGDRINHVNGSGVMVGSDWDGDLFIYHNGERRMLAGAIVRATGDVPPLETLTVGGLGESGDVLLNSPASSGTGAAYVLRSGTLRRLWEGTANAVNAAGMVVGTRRLPEGGTIGVALMPDGSIVDMPALGDALAVTDAGVVIGNTAGGRLGLWRDGSLSGALPAVPPPPPGGLPTWIVHDVDESGRMLADARWDYGLAWRRVLHDWVQFRDIRVQRYLYTPAEGFRLLTDVVAGTSLVLESTMPTRILASGVLAAARALYMPSEESGTPGPAAAAVDLGGVVLGAAGAQGEPVALRPDGAGWDERVLPVERDGYISDTGGMVVYTDPRDGRAHAVVRAGASLRWFRATPLGDWEAAGALPLPAGAPAVVGDLTVFTAGGRVAVCGVDAAGDLILFYQTGAAGAQDWVYANLSRDHVRASGVEPPRLAGPLTAYATPWGGMNIAGLDARGHVMVVWWAPGMGLWSASDLSLIAGPPVLHGRVVSMVTAWGGVTLAAAEEGDGDVWAVWWAPGMALWSASELDAGGGGAEGPTLAADSLTAYTTSWGGMTIAGRDAASGEAAVLWWAPGAAGWTAQRVPVEVAGEAPVRLSGRVVSAVEGGAAVSLFGREQAGGLVRLLWRPGDALWSVEALPGTPLT